MQNIEYSIHAGIFVAILIQTAVWVALAKKGSVLKNLYNLVYLTIMLPLRAIFIPIMIFAKKDRAKIWSVVIADLTGILLYTVLYFFGIRENLLISGALCYLFAGSFANTIYFGDKLIQTRR